jgi:hypothetical protein
MKTIGNGLQTKPGEKHRSCLKILPMQEADRILSKDPTAISWKNQNWVLIFFADGHTEKQMIPHIQYKDKNCFCAFIGYSGHIPVSIRYGLMIPDLY